MSKPLPAGQAVVRLEPAEQIRHFADLYRRSVNPDTLARLSGHTRALGLDFPLEELLIIAALDTPDKVQEFLNTQIYYNNDHASPDLEETAMSPRRVLQTALAHCFEGAMFAYAVNYVHGQNPRLFLLEASQDSEHNLVLFQDPETGLLGVNAHSAFPHLDGRPAQYPSIRAIAESYYPYYYSDRTWNPNDITLVGYSDPFDLVSKFGPAWMASEEPLWDIYYTYVDDTLAWHYLFDDSNQTHIYPLINALRHKWIQVDGQGRSNANVNNLPPAALELWQAFWKVFDARDPRPRGIAREIEERFFKLTGTTPIDLYENAEELGYFVERGYRIEQLLTRGAG
jgi:hypothetical protein